MAGEQPLGSHRHPGVLSGGYSFCLQRLKTLCWNWLRDVFLVVLVTQQHSLLRDGENLSQQCQQEMRVWIWHCLCHHITKSGLGDSK